jgi:hypothetical protein
MKIARHLLALAMFASCPVVTAAAAAQDWHEYWNEKYEFSIRVPAEHFRQGTARNPEAGALWIARDGQARLIAVAGENEIGGSLQDYRSFVMEKTYANARFTYTPVRDDWFVLSGVQDDQIFYERITFVCGGPRYIYGWQLHYPARQKRLYDRIVEQIDSNYRIRRGEGGRCD